MRSSGRASRRCSPPTTSCHGGRRRRARSGAQLLARFGPRHRPQRTRSAEPRRARRRRGGDPASCLSERSATRRRRTHAPRASERSVPTRVSATRSRRAKLIDGARLLVAGDPIEAVNGYRSAARRARGVASRVPLAARSSSARSARRPSRSSRIGRSSTRAARSCRRSAPGCPPWPTTSAGIAEPIATFGAGRVVPAGDVEALAAAARELLDEPSALEPARAGARRAREALTWDAAAAHLELYRELT